MSHSIEAPGFPHTLAAAKTASASCDTIYNFNLGAPSTTISVFSVNTSSNCTTGGFVAGNNCYGDLEKANYFTGTTYSAMVTPSVTGCFIFFFKTPSGIGTKGVAAHTVNLKLYGGTMASGPTSTMGVTSLSFSAINSAFSATNSLGSVQFTFPTGVPLTGSGFFTSVVLPASTGDTLAIFQQVSAPADAGWEMDYLSAWYNMKTNWGGTTNFQLCMFPVIGCSEFVGIKNNDLDPFFNVVPNPSAGQFSLVSGLSGLSFDLRITNSVGQVLMEKKSVSGGSVSDIDLSNYSGGIYFATITAGSNSITKKLVLNK
ncbi:MAG: T9SS type A sorting domain-containing protein [Bacteroidia bacterium]